MAIVFTGRADGLTDDSFLSATEDLEGVAIFQVHGGAAPYLGLFTIAAAKGGHGNRHHVVTLPV